MATEILTGSRLAACIWQEAAWGTESVGTAFSLPISVANVTVGESQTFIDSQIARGDRKEQVPYPGTFSSEGNSFTFIGHYCSFIHLLKHVLGETVVVSGDGTPYIHTLTSLTDLPEGFGLELALVDPATAADSICYRAYGCRIQSITMPIAKPAGEMDIQVSFVAKKVVREVDTPTAATEYSPTTDGEVPILFNKIATLTINDGGGADAIGDLLEASITINCEAEYQHTCNNSGRVGMFGSGITRVRGTGRAMLHADSVYESLAEAGTYVALHVVITDSANVGLDINLPYCRLMKKPLAISGPMGIGVDLEFTAPEDPDTATSPITLIFNNLQDGADWEYPVA